MSSSKTGEVAKNYEMLANPVFIQVELLSVLKMAYLIFPTEINNMVSN